MSRKNIPWRDPEEHDNYPSCEVQMLPPGILISQNPFIIEIVGEGDATYQPACYKGTPVLPAMRKLPYDTIPNLTRDWLVYTASNGGRFGYSIYPIIYSISTCTTLTVFLSVMVFTNYTRNPSMLLKAALLGASCYVLASFIIAIGMLERQHDLGYISSEQLMTSFTESVPLSVIDLLAVVLLQVAQVQIVMRLFSRQRDKRVAFFVGVTLSVSSQVIWAVSRFVNSNEATLVVLPAFIYLLRIAMSILYLGLVMVYIFLKRQFVFQKSLVMLTLLVVLVVNASIVLFVVDMANFWVSTLSEIFNVACYVASIVIPWEWINLIKALEKVKEKDGILGREVYAEEMVDETCHPYAKVISNGSWSVPSGTAPSISTGEAETGPALRAFEGAHLQDREAITHLSQIFTSKIRAATDKVLQVTDQVIAHGFSVPRIDSASSNRPSPGVRSDVPAGAVYVYTACEVSFPDEDINLDDTSSSTAPGRYERGAAPP